MKRRDLLRIATPCLFGRPAFAQVSNVTSNATSNITQPTKILVGFAAGGPTDIVARAVANRISAKLGRQFYIENKPGASGTLAAIEATRARPDGLTLLINASTSHTFYPLSSRKSVYDAISGFTYITLIDVAPTVIAVSPKLGVNSLREFVALLKANPGKYSFGSAGAGSMSQLAGEMFKQQAGVDMIHVPYKGAAPGMQDLISGEIAVYMDTFSTELPYHSQGLIRILAVCDKKRSEVARDIPTTAEEGLPGLLANTYNALLGPPQMPRPVVDELANAMREISADAEFMKIMQALSVEVRVEGPEAAVRFAEQEIEKWRPIVASVGLKLDY